MNLSHKVWFLCVCQKPNKSYREDRSSQSLKPPSSSKDRILVSKLGFRALSTAAVGDRRAPEAAWVDAQDPPPALPPSLPPIRPFSRYQELPRGLHCGIPSLSLSAHALPMRMRSLCDMYRSMDGSEHGKNAGNSLLSSSHRVVAQS